MSKYEYKIYGEHWKVLAEGTFSAEGYEEVEATEARLIKEWEARGHEVLGTSLKRI